MITLTRLPKHPAEIEWENHPGRYDDVVIKHRLCTWVLPECVARHALKYNPRHLPVVIRKPDNEDYYLRWSVRRIVRGYRAFRTYFPPSPFIS